MSASPPQLPPRFPVIVGPTAGGKSSLAVEVALTFAHRNIAAPHAGEIVTADAFQLYRGMDIGTAKPTLAERKNVPHHLIDVRDPRDPAPFTVHDWLHAAEAAIADCRARNTLPILVGGTHLYIQNFLTGMFQGPGADEALRAQLRSRGLANLREELERVDPDAARRIHPNDERRSIRALEVFHLTGTPISEHQKQWGAESRTDCVLVILDWPTELINRRINARVKQMMADGFLEEVQRLKAEGAFAEGANPQAREALGYKQLLAHLDGKGSLDDAVEQIKIDTRHFAKAQRTWLRRLRMTPGCVVIDAATTPMEEWPGIVLKACGDQGPTPPTPTSPLVEAIVVPQDTFRTLSPSVEHTQKPLCPNAIAERIQARAPKRPFGLSPYLFGITMASLGLSGLAATSRAHSNFSWLALAIFAVAAASMGYMLYRQLRHLM